MGLLSQNANDISNEVSAILRIVRSHYRNDIKLQIMNALCIDEFKLKIIRKNYTHYKFLFLIKIPKDYPFEPLWAEPVIVSKEMRNQFHRQNYRSFKLRPLVDSLIMFCHKYDAHNPQSLMISFPATKMYGEKEINSKVFMFLSKTFSKFSNRFTIDVPHDRGQKSVINCRGFPNNDYYNDMGISMYNYINMLNRITSVTKRKSNAICASNANGKSSQKPKHEHGKEFLITRSKEIKRHLSKTLFSKLTKRSINKIYDRRLKEYNSSKTNMLKLKDLIYTFDAASMEGIEIDFLEEFSVEIDEGCRITLNRFNHVLMIKNNVFENQFKNVVELSPTFQEPKPFNVKLVALKNTVSMELLPMHCREIIPASFFAGCWLELYGFLLNFSKSENNFIKSLQKLDNVTQPDKNVIDCKIESPKPLEISSSFTGFYVEELINYEIDLSIALIDKIKNAAREKYRIVPMKVFNDSIVFHQPFLKDRIAQQLMLNGDLPSTEFEIQSKLMKPTRSPLTLLYSEIISEVIQYPKSQSGLFEYTLELNPRSARHRTLLECIGLLKYKHFSALELLAPDDYKLRLFFVKEIFNPNGRGVVIKLHKLSPRNKIHKLISEENDHFQKMSETNRAVWCSEIASVLSLDLLRVLCGLGKLFVDSLGRKRRMKTEARSMNCADLPVQRYSFPDEVIESLSIFTVVASD